MENQNHKHHHILPTKVALAVGGTLLFLTFITVWIAGVDLGKLNFLVAMVVATIKASLVMLIFMNLLYDRRENSVIFLTSFVFLAIFIVLTGADLFFRGDVAVKGPLVAAQTVSKLKNPWISTPDLVSKGKELYAVQCATCHGVNGDGKGPAAPALNPPPRNFTATTGWKNGRKPTMVFKTLKEGLPPSAMASFATLPADDRWALAHFVLSLAPNPEKDTPGDFAKIGIDPSKEGGGATEAPTIPIELAMKRIAVPDSPSTGEEAHGMNYAADQEEGGSIGARVYRMNCKECHGAQGQGGISVRTLGVRPQAQMKTYPMKDYAEALKSQDTFNQVVIQGLPGTAMPGNGQLSGAELRELYQYVKTLR